LKRKIAAAVVAAAALTVSAACSSSGSGGNSSSTSNFMSGSTSATGTLNVWLLSKWNNNEVPNATAAFNKLYPNVKVNVEYQSWGTYTSKYQAALKAGNAPDVEEFGNTDTALPIAGGAFQNLTSIKSQFPNSSSWLTSLADSSTSASGALDAVPYYAGDRLVAYNESEWTAAGISSPPTTWSQLLGDIQTLNTKNAGTTGFSAFYLPAGYEYLALSMIEDAGGQLATESGGKWTAQFNSAADVKGLENFFQLWSTSKNNPSDVNDLNISTPLTTGYTASSIYNDGLVTEPTPAPANWPTFGYFDLPSPTNAGKNVPEFLGGSDLGITATSKLLPEADAFTAELTSTTSETAYGKEGWIPNASALDSSLSGTTAQFAQAAAAGSWFVPNSVNWGKIDGTPNYIDETLEAIAAAGATPSSIQTNTTNLDNQVDSILNG
jgi:N,N'-diacetylchitobiose transport system substrate-binding protein